MNELNEVKIGGVYQAPKPWPELTTDEKIERTREVVKSLQRHVSRAQSDIHVLKNNFKKHSHNGEGIVVPYDEYASNQLNGIADSLSSVANFF